MGDEATGQHGYNTGVDMMGTRRQAQPEGEMWLRCECGTEWRAMWGRSCSRCAEARQQPLAPVALIRALPQTVPSKQVQSDQDLAKDILDGIEADAQSRKEWWMVAGYTPELKTVEDGLAQTIPSRMPADPQASAGWSLTAEGTTWRVLSVDKVKPEDAGRLPYPDIDPMTRQLVADVKQDAAYLNACITRELDALRAAMSEDKASDHVGPDDAAHRSAKDTVDHLVNGRITAPARKAIGDALDTANRAPPPNPTGATKPSPWHNGRRGVSVGDGILR